jgi:hypothetical protein
MAQYERLLRRFYLSERRTGTVMVRVREFVAWGFDQNDYRPSLNSLAPAVERGCCAVARREPYVQADPVCNNLPAPVTDLIARQVQRSDLQAEMQGLEWSVGVVDLRCLLAFQRRLIFDAHFPQAEVPAADDWPSLVALAFGPPISIAYTMVVSSASEIQFQSESPNFQVRLCKENTNTPLQIYGGSPFFEVAEYRGRWFLRDGYHRAFHLLSANIVHFPAVIIRAKTLAELGPIQPWFFSEDTLFSPQPPRLPDFLDDDLTVEYSRPRLLKTLRVTIEESVEPAQPAINLGERQ